MLGQQGWLDLGGTVDGEKLYRIGSIAFSIPACLVSDHADVVLMSCQLKLSTPQSRSIPWRSLLKVKYVIYHISPSKMAHSSHATKGARTAVNLVCYAT